VGADTPYTLPAFHKEFPTDDVCLEWLKRRLFPDGIYCSPCGRLTRHHRVKGRKSYACQHCGHHVHPTAGTIFHKSATPLTTWFYAIFLITSAEYRISIRQLQRELGVTPKTASRMSRRIRALLDGVRETEAIENASAITAHPAAVKAKRREKQEGSADAVTSAERSDARDVPDWEKGERLRQRFVTRMAGRQVQAEA
jgi:transposase-like protein